MEVTLTNTVDLIETIRAGQSILPIRKGHINYDAGWATTKISSKVTTIDLVDIREKYYIPYTI